MSWAEGGCADTAQRDRVPGTYPHPLPGGHLPARRGARVAGGGPVGGERGRGG